MQAILFFLSLTILTSIVGHAQEVEYSQLSVPFNEFLRDKWYERVNFRGYTQIRYNRLFESNPQLKCRQCDRSLGENKNFFVRRARMVFFGELDERVFFYIQPDFASSPLDNKEHFVQIRDLYFDISLDAKKEYRLRVGQSKVPFGFENLQSSSRRLTPDRNDPLNSAVANERDLGVFFYWAPEHIRKLFIELGKNNLKGSGDYGVFGFGAYNGQTANSSEQNNNLHIVTRFSLPMKLSNGQIIEPSIQAYSGKFAINVDTTTPQFEDFKDERLALSFVSYPMPFGIQAEYNWGEGPQFDLQNNNIVDRSSLHGGYLQLMYHIQHKSSYYMPFIKTQHYNGGKKHERAAHYKVTQHEMGLEWQPFPSFELTAAWAIEDRVITTANGIDDQSGHRLRLQDQFNY